MMSGQGILIVLSGPSGVGKGAVSRALLGESTDLVCSISATTRLPRKGEVNGKSYYFFSRQEFRKMIDRQELLEWAEVYGNFYGTPRVFVENALSEGRDVLLEIDVQGGLQVKQMIPAAVLVFLFPPSRAELQSRLLKRASESLAEMEKRLKWAEQELKMLSRYDYAVVNDRVENAVWRIQSILEAEKCRTWRFKNC
ncbi:MAG TPA: guanylate kinase [Desulfotomaculum sp.]|nr:guanylate kinase [Desulfotomaculum sp.]